MQRTAQAGSSTWDVIVDAAPQIQLAPLVPLAPNRRKILLASLSVYTVLVAFLATSQWGYLNADFIGYATIAHRLLSGTGGVTAYWSPLFSWCMLPLIAAGVDDQLAGRLVLVLAGGFYLFAIAKVLERFASGQPNRDRTVTVGVSAIAVIQAAVWATYFLDPDLLADALLFLYFARVLDPELAKRPRRAFHCGALGGLAYLAKAYMLPFVIVHFPATLLLRRILLGGRRTNTNSDRRASLAVCAVFFAGLSVVAGPWIGVLSRREGRPTFSTAGSSNHANMSPTNAGHDPLWNPGLVADFIADPRLAPDWSPLQDVAHFRHQGKLFVHNAGNCLGTAIFWFVLAAGAGVYVIRRQRQARRRVLSNQDRFAGWWSLMTVAIYCGGYCFVNLEARYIVPVVAPLLCGCALLAITAVSADFPEIRNHAPRWLSSAGTVAFILLFSAQDLHRMYDVAFHHLHGTPMTALRPIARELEAAGLSHELTVGNRDHEMLVITYLCGSLQTFLGMPASKTAEQIKAELDRSGARVYVRLTDGASIASLCPVDAFVPPAPWKSVLLLSGARMKPWTATVFTRDDPSRSDTK